MRHKKSTLPFWKASKPRKIMTMGLGSLGRDLTCPECGTEFKDCTSIVFKRKFRWTLEGETPEGKIEQVFVKVNARPQPDIEETEINYLSAKTWIPGKIGAWQEMTVTLFDVSHDDKCMSVIYTNLAKNLVEGEVKEPETLSKFKLHLYDGCGCLIETWDLDDAYFSKANWGEFDHSSSECVTLELTLRYKKVTYNSEFSSGQYLNGGMGLGSYGNYKATCPNCKHEFVSLPNSPLQ